MTEASRQPNEAQRLDTLKQLRLLDTPIEERFERITRLTTRLMNVPIASFTLIDEGRQWFKSIQGLPQAGAETPRSISFCDHVVANGDLMVVSDASVDDRFSDNPFVTNDPNIKFYAGYPIRAPNGMAVGSLCAVDNKIREISPEEIQTLRDMAALIEMELHAANLSHTQAGLMEELSDAKQMALVDPMTRLWNRRGIMTLMEREWAEAERQHTTLGVIVADIDHFKSINDTFGHAGGDDVLKSVGRTLLSAIRAEDAVGRMGGEEFLIILPRMHPREIMTAAERIRSAVEDAPIKMNGKDHKITMSFGTSILNPVANGFTVEDLIKQADDALYRAKRGGRNRVEAHA
ncbi:MAG TPA: sensor domain-containing diguanylate cyclase [Alphaproteobacteria bacterium]